MSVRDVESILGPPNDESAYVTGKAFIPFYFGPDRTRRGLEPMIDRSSVEDARTWLARIGW